MPELFRMDCRRLARWHWLHVVLGFEVAVVFLVALSNGLLSNPEVQAWLDQFGQVDYQEAARIRQLSFLELWNVTHLLNLLSAYLVGIYTVGEITSGFRKNIFCGRAARGGYLAAKTAAAALVAAVVVAVYLVCGLLFSWLWGLRPPLDSALDIAQFAFLKWLVCWAFGTMMIFAALLLQSDNRVGVLAIFVGGGMAQWWGYQVLQAAGIAPAPLLYSLALLERAVPTAFDAGAFARVTAGSLAWGCVYTLLSLLVLKKRDAA